MIVIFTELVKVESYCLEDAPGIIKMLHRLVIESLIHLVEFLMKLGVITVMVLELFFSK